MRKMTRWLPRRVVVPLAAALVGALLGATTVAWRTDTLPLVTRDDQACWGSLGDDDVADLVGTEDVRVEEQRPRYFSDTSFEGACRISARGLRVDVRVHHAVYGGPEYPTLPEHWVREFLVPEATWLGGGLTGMASPTRAWLAVPETCERATDVEGPLIVDVASSRRTDEEVGDAPQAAGTAERDVLARVVTRVVNGVMALLDCDGSLPDPTGLPDVPVPETRNGQDGLCAIDGLTRPRGVPAAKVEVQRVSNGGGRVHSCELGSREERYGNLRLTTIEVPSMTDSMYALGRDRGEDFTDERVRGTFSPALGVAHAGCQTGRVIFLLQQLRPPRDEGVARALFPAYVEAEAERIGCGPLTVQLPE